MENQAIYGYPKAKGDLSVLYSKNVFVIPLITYVTCTGISNYIHFTMGKLTDASLGNLRIMNCFRIT